MRLFILLVITFFFSCRTSRDDKSVIHIGSVSYDCHELDKFLSESWKKNKEGYFYFERPPEDYNKVYYSKYMENCLKGQTKKDIKKKFGNPSAQALNRFYYYMTEECAKGIPPDSFDRKCMLLTIYFDDNDRVRGIPPITFYHAPIK